MDTLRECMLGMGFRYGDSRVLSEGMSILKHADRGIMLLARVIDMAAAILWKYFERECMLRMGFRYGDTQRLLDTWRARIENGI